MQYYKEERGKMSFRSSGMLLLTAAVMLLVFGITGDAQVVQQEAQVPCFFIFGDSLVDNGNNNGMLTLARANYRPYGIDFPLGPTGRFTNGQTYVDALSRLLGFQAFIPPFARARGRELLRGVNFASGAAGIRDETGNNLGDHASMNQQVINFGRTVEFMQRYFRGDASLLKSYLGRCIYYSGMGSNDYLNNYFMPTFYTTSSDYTPKAFASLLLQDYANQLAKLYSMGARKVIVTSVGQIGCIPYQLARYTNNNNNTNIRNNNTNTNKNSRCNENINRAISIFNTGLRRLVQRFNSGTELPGAKFVYLDFYKSTSDLYLNSTASGFEVVDKGCCGVGRNNGQITCLPLQQACQDRRKYLFWDAFHPTEVANVLSAQSSFSTNSFTYPINIQQLAMS
ncbi:GDSL esterase/lipase At1g33811 [Linum grandiflorum]